MQAAAWQGGQRRRSRRNGLVIVIAALAGVGAVPTARPPAPVTDATVAERVASATTVADHRALAAYYKEKAAAEGPRIDYFDRLFRSYKQLDDAKTYAGMQRQARELLRAARLSRKYFDLLATAHTTRALKLSEPP